MPLLDETAKGVYVIAASRSPTTVRSTSPASTA